MKGARMGSHNSTPEQSSHASHDKFCSNGLESAELSYVWWLVLHQCACHWIFVKITSPTWWWHADQSNACTADASLQSHTCCMCHMSDIAGCSIKSHVFTRHSSTTATTSLSDDEISRFVPDLRIFFPDWWASTSRSSTLVMLSTRLSCKSFVVWLIRIPMQGSIRWLNPQPPNSTRIFVICHAPLTVQIL